MRMVETFAFLHLIFCQENLSEISSSSAFTCPASIRVFWQLASVCAWHFCFGWYIFCLCWRFVSLRCPVVIRTSSRWQIAVSRWFERMLSTQDDLRNPWCNLELPWERHSKPYMITTMCYGGARTAFYFLQFPYLQLIYTTQFGWNNPISPTYS